MESNLFRFFHRLVVSVLLFYLVGIPLTGLTPPQYCICPYPGPGFPMSYVVVFCVQWCKMGNDCPFCWYWSICLNFLFIKSILF